MQITGKVLLPCGTHIYMEQGYKQSVLSSVCQFVSVRPPRSSKCSAYGSICVHLHTCMRRSERVPTAFSAY